MPIKYKPLSGSHIRKTGLLHWDKGHREEKRLLPHGVWVYVGPKGAGKSLLAHCHSWMLAHGQFRNPDGNCLCGDPSCNAVWQVYTMHEAPTLQEYGAWAKRLDLGELLAVGDEGEQHIVIYIDEVSQYANSRRGMISEAIKLLNKMTFTRKGKIIFIGTAISIDWIDVRLRDQATQIFNCWTPNEGKTVYANVHQLSLGHLPPHMRHSVQPETRWWPTAWAHTKNGGLGIYNTNELVDASADFASARTEPIFYVQSESGVLEQKQYSEALAEAIEDMLHDGKMVVTPDDLIGLVKSKYGDIPIKQYWVRQWLQEMGFQRGETAQDFIIGTMLQAVEE